MLASQNGHFSIVESLLRKGAWRQHRSVEGEHKGRRAADVASTPVVKYLLENYECMIVCDEVGKEYCRLRWCR